jgi:hypothetical protein
MTDACLQADKNSWSQGSSMLRGACISTEADNPHALNNYASNQRSDVGPRVHGHHQIAGCRSDLVRHGETIAVPVFSGPDHGQIHLMPNRQQTPRQDYREGLSLLAVHA